MEPSLHRQSQGLWIPFAELRTALACAAAIAREPEAWGCAANLRDVEWARRSVRNKRAQEVTANYYLFLPPAGDQVSIARAAAVVTYCGDNAAPKFTRPPEIDLHVSFLSGLATELAGKPRDSHSLEESRPQETEEWLVVCPSDVVDPLFIYEGLRTGGQRVRWAVGCSGETWHHLFWVRQTMHTALRLETGIVQLSAGAVILSGSAAAGGLFFLKDRRLGSALLHELGELVTAAPGLFGVVHGESSRLRPLFAAWEGDDQTAPSLLLGLLTFEAVRPEVWLPLEPCATLELKTDAEREDKFSNDLKALPASPGYQLRLIDFPLDERSKDYKQELAMRLAMIEDELLALKLEDPESPVIYRFDFAQIEDVARLLHEFAPHERSSGQLEYACACPAGDEANGGYHYLLAADTTSIQRLHTKVAAHAMSPRPRRYQVDPLWAEHYQNSEQSYWVMVPHQTALLPSLHSWNAGELEKELGDAVGAMAGQTIPKQPIYLFEGETGAYRVGAVVLDRKKFDTFPNAFRLLNDNLRLVEAVGVPEAARALADKAFASTLLAEATQSIDQLEARLAQAHAKQISRFLASTEHLHTELRRRLEENLESLAGLHEQYRAVAGVLGRFNSEFEKHRTASAELLKPLIDTLVPGGTAEEHCVALMAQAAHLLREAAPRAPGASQARIHEIANEVRALIEAQSARVDQYARDGLPEHLARPLREADHVINKAEERRKTLSQAVAKKIDALIELRNKLLKRLGQALVFRR